jgi:tetratricopeptide (TPR) repeat protein
MVDTLAWVEHLLGNNTAAAALLQEAIKRAPTNAEIQLHAAQVAAARGLTSEAAAHLQQALKRDPALASRRDVADLESSLKNARP